jgi:hypothetical protein
MMFKTCVALLYLKAPYLFSYLGVGKDVNNALEITLFNFIDFA